MPYGPTPPKKLPRQRAETILLHAERFNYAADHHRDWAEPAKQAVQYYEGNQYTAADRAKLDSEGRPDITINKIKPLVNLVQGYFINNTTDIAYLPGHDGSGTQRLADALTHTSKQISQISHLPWVDSQVFMDGLLTGRGYFDFRLDFHPNDFGQGVWTAGDPFATYLDPDGDDYDPEKWNWIFESRWISIDEVEAVWGRRIHELIKPLANGHSFSDVPSHLYDGEEEITPWRSFGGEEDSSRGWRAFSDSLFDWVDTARKNIRLIDTQHYVYVHRWLFVDLETGYRREIPEHWSRERINRVLAYAVSNGDPVTVVRRMVRKVRWTQMIGDILVYDDWSPYSTFTKIPFFPYFRRGKTRGMVEDLISPQDEINKRRSARLNIIGRSSNGGWIYAEGSFNPQQKDNLEQFGSAPGAQIEYRVVRLPGGRVAPEPKQIQPSIPPVAMAQLEEEAENDLVEISGINRSALGQIDTVQSGRAIEARQRQAIVGLEGMIANWTMTKQIAGKKQLEVIQEHYREQRVVRVITDAGAPPDQVILNERTARGMMNNVSLGTYTVSVDQRPLSKTFLDAVFEEMMRMKEIGMPIPDEDIIDASSMPRKDQVKARMAEERRLRWALAGAAGGGNGADGLPVPTAGGAPTTRGGDGRNIPGGGEPGAPTVTG